MNNTIQSFNEYIKNMGLAKDKDLMETLALYERVFGRPPSIPLVGGLFGREGRMSYEEAGELQELALKSAVNEWKKEIAMEVDKHR